MLGRRVACDGLDCGLKRRRRWRRHSRLKMQAIDGGAVRSPATLGVCVPAFGGGLAAFGRAFASAAPAAAVLLAALVTTALALLTALVTPPFAGAG